MEDEDKPGTKIDAAIMGDCLLALSRFITRGSRRYRAEQQAGFTQDSARAGAVTLIQRFGAALNLNITSTCSSSMASTSMPPAACALSG